MRSSAGHDMPMECGSTRTRHHAFPSLQTWAGVEQTSRRCVGDNDERVAVARGQGTLDAPKTERPRWVECCPPEGEKLSFEVAGRPTTVDQPIAVLGRRSGQRLLWPKCPRLPVGKSRLQAAFPPAGSSASRTSRIWPSSDVCCRVACFRAGRQTTYFKLSGLTFAF